MKVRLHKLTITHLHYILLSMVVGNRRHKKLSIVYIVAVDVMRWSRNGGLRYHIDMYMCKRSLNTILCMGRPRTIRYCTSYTTDMPTTLAVQGIEERIQP